jgi:hypothetical protein
VATTLCNFNPPELSPLKLDERWAIGDSAGRMMVQASAERIELIRAPVT